MIRSNFLMGAALCLCAAFLCAGAAQAKDAGVTAGTTLENLQAAYNGESNANAKYLAFAKKADEEGYGKAASLFRAAARAEQVHIDNHSKIIAQLGAAPKAEIVQAEVRSTKENLEAARDGETYESAKMYPAFLKVAKKDKNTAAVESFDEARRAEAVHAKLYKKALKDLPAWKAANQEFWVCPECGNVVEKKSGGRCPICNTPMAEFLPVS